MLRARTNETLACLLLACAFFLVPGYFQKPATQASIEAAGNPVVRTLALALVMVWLWSIATLRVVARGQEVLTLMSRGFLLPARISSNQHLGKCFDSITENLRRASKKHYITVVHLRRSFCHGQEINEYTYITFICPQIYNE